ncbi:UNVERIFIED_CONTAM: hypothetical protein RMT77_004230 [Armadillidium vulgare]|nr:FYVE, RhoGEF and PH domain-containing protein 6 [Armadillidium vulgare]
MNSKLLEEILLEKDNIGNAFLKFGPFLKVYSSYANNFQRSLEILQKWESECEPFRSFISDTETRPEIQAKLSSLLITPIQRIPRYKLLLEELLKYSDFSESSFKDLEGALLKVSEAASHIDKSVFESQAFNKLLKVQRALKDQQPNIIAPGRKLLKEGILNKVSRKGKGSQARLFFLFSDMLIYTKLPSQNVPQASKEVSCAPTEIDLKPGSLECCCMLPLRYCRVNTVFGGSGDQGITFRLQCSDEDLLLYSAVASEGEEWIKAIREASQEALRKRKTLRKASSRRKAIRRTPLKGVIYNEDNQDVESNSDTESKSLKFPFELQMIRSTMRIARDCFTPPKSKTTLREQKKAASINSESWKMVGNSKCSLVTQLSPVNMATSRIKPLSPLATCSWENGSSPRSDNKSFTYQNGVRGGQGSQLTITSPVKNKESPLSGFFSPRKKRKCSNL